MELNSGIIIVPPNVPTKLLLEPAGDKQTQVTEYGVKYMWNSCVLLLGKHWRDTKGGAPFQCSLESDLDFHVEPNEFHMTVCLARPRLIREPYEDHEQMWLASNNWIGKLLVATWILQILLDIS